MHRPVIATRRALVQSPRAMHTLRDGALLLVGVAALVATLLTTSGSLRIFGS